MNTQQFLEQVFATLEVSDDKQSHMMKQVEEVVQMTVLEKLIGQLSKEDQEILKEQLKSKKPEEQREILNTYLKNHYTEQEVKDKYLIEAAQEVVPDYIKTILGAASEEQKQKVNQLLQYLTSQQTS